MNSAVNLNFKSHARALVCRYAKPMLVSVVALGNYCCVTAKKDVPLSAWRALDDAGEVECETWPLGEKDLAVRGLHVLETSPPSILAEIVRRDGKPALQMATVGNSAKIDRDKVKSIILGRSSTVVGGSTLGKKNFVAVLQRDGSKSVLEFRSLPDNVLIGKSQANLPEADSGALIKVGESFGLLLQISETEAAVAMVRVDSAKRTLNLKTIAEARKLRSPEFVASGGKAYLLSLGSSKLVAEASDAKSAQTFSTPVNLFEISESGKVESVNTSALTTAAEVESWLALSSGGSLRIGAIEGDSMVGASSLRVWQGEKEIGMQTLQDLHVSDLHALSTKVGKKFSFLGWIDEESTLYVFDAGPKVLQAKTSGVFKKGTRAVASTLLTDGHPLVIFRQKADDGWAYQACRLEAE